MGALLIAFSAVIHQGEAMIVKYYGKKHGVGAMFFNAIACLFSSIFFLVTDKGGLYFPKEMFAYGIANCLMYALGFYSSYVAFRLGSYAATMLMSSFSGVISVCYGIMFLKESSSVATYIAITLIFLSVFLIQYEKTAQNENKNFSAKWFLWALLTALSNGFIAVISRMQQIRFDHAYDNEFLVFSYCGSFVVLLIMSMLKERDNIGYILRHGMFWGMGTGLLNGIKNLTILMIYLFIPISVATPIRTGVGLMAAFMVSVLIYREKFTIRQLAGVGIGILALVLFKL